MTIDEAREVVVGIDGVWDSSVVLPGPPGGPPRGPAVRPPGWAGHLPGVGRAHLPGAGGPPPGSRPAVRRAHT